MTDLEKIIAEIRAQSAVLHRGCPESCGSPLGKVLDDWADRLAALAGAEPVAFVRWSPKHGYAWGTVHLRDAEIVNGDWRSVPLYTHAPAKAREVTDADVLSALRAHIDRWPSQAAFAKHHSVSPQYVSDVLAGRRYIPEGWVSVIGYRKAGWVQDKAAALATFAEGE